jgi:hypothetical protein
MPSKAAILLLFFSCLSEAGEFHIQAFDTTRVFPQKSDYLLPLKGHLLQAANPGPINGSEMFLRRKFGKDSYALFKGRANPEHISNLYHMQMPRSMTWEALLKIKFYETPKASYWRDIKDIYFNGEGDIFVVNRAILYFMSDTGWQSITMVQAKENDIEESSAVLTNIHVAREDFTGEGEKHISISFIFINQPYAVEDKYLTKEKAYELVFHNTQLGPSQPPGISESPFTHSSSEEVTMGLQRAVKVRLYTHQKLDYKIERHFGTVVFKYKIKTRKTHIPKPGGVVERVSDFIEGLGL